MAEPRKPGPRPPERQAPPVVPPPTPPPEPERKAPVLDESFQKEALEICRQELKKMEFWAKCKEVLEASVVAESTLAQKKAAVEEVEKTARGQEATHKASLGLMEREAETKKGEMEKDYVRKETELKKRLEALSRSVDDVTTERDQLSKEVERLRGERIKEMNDLEKVKEQAAKEKAEIEIALQKQKKDSDQQLEDMKQAIRRLQSGVARIPV